MTQMQANALREQLKALTDRMPGAAGKQAAKQAGKQTGKQGYSGRQAGQCAGRQTRRVARKDWPIVSRRNADGARYPQEAKEIRQPAAQSGHRPDGRAANHHVARRRARRARIAAGNARRTDEPLGLSDRPLAGSRAEAGRRRTIFPGSSRSASCRRKGPIAMGEQPIVDVQLPAVVNGQILSGQVDRYRFAAKKGQHLVIAVSAQQLVPYIADAVPGWFQAAIRLSDEEGKEVAYAGNFRFHPDPVLHYEVPRDGKYLVEIHDSVFRGREDFIYRMALGELPFVTGIFPLGGKAGEVTRIAVQGWNLPSASLKVDSHPQSAGIDAA